VPDRVHRPRFGPAGKSKASSDRHLTTAASPPTQRSVDSQWRGSAHAVHLRGDGGDSGAGGAG
jgi:hypothetical protein